VEVSLRDDEDDRQDRHVSAALLPEGGRSRAAARGLSGDDRGGALIEGLSFAAYRRVSTVIFVPAPSGGGVEMVTIDPSDLEAAQHQDAALKQAEGR
jgi:hypothetical protein